MKELYDKDYFERGIETGKSCYQNYRWIPELTIPMAMTIIDYLGIKPYDEILDFGCAKGYLVKAFRWLNRKAYGMDISRYAIENCDPEVKDYCSLIGLEHRYPCFDFVIAKDVFEHVPLDDLSKYINRMGKTAIFAVIPFGDNGSFRAPANNIDITHINCMNEKEWEQFFNDNGLFVKQWTHRIEGIKDSYYEKYPTGHGFFTLSR